MAEVAEPHEVCSQQMGQVAVRDGVREVQCQHSDRCAVLCLSLAASPTLDMCRTVLLPQVPQFAAAVC